MSTAAERKRAQRERAREAGLCIKCCREPALPRRTQCAACTPPPKSAGSVTAREYRDDLMDVDDALQSARGLVIALRRDARKSIPSAIPGLTVLLDRISDARHAVTEAARQ